MVPKLIDPESRVTVPVGTVVPVGVTVTVSASVWLVMIGFSEAESVVAVAILDGSIRTVATGEVDAV
jgi:hypothetical protein